MLAVTAYPIIYAFVLSLQRSDLRFPDENEFIGLDNYGTVLSSALWWQDVFNTVIITVISVSIELVLGMVTRAGHAPGDLRPRRWSAPSSLIPYGIVTVVAAFAWQLAFAPDSRLRPQPASASTSDPLGDHFGTLRR